MNYVYYPDYLEHHGILGMKWGIRRYQNSDGSWTDEGKIRRRSGKYINSDGSLTKAGVDKYSGSKNLDETINKRHYELVKDFNKGKVSKKALDQVGIKDKELEYLTNREAVVRKEVGGAKVGSIIGALAAGSAYVAINASTYGGVPISSLSVLTGIGATYGAVLGTIAGGGIASKDIDKMRESEEAFINSMPKDKQEKYMRDAYQVYVQSSKNNQRMTEEYNRIHQEFTRQAMMEEHNRIHQEFTRQAIYDAHHGAHTIQTQMHGHMM